ncbi:UBA-like protein [Pseudocohnilembus persalinus]|uniref:UBA-like protein n=1 Tax=Pseudocohnilembus persalinus TaxID=266149 RepID=A0A0V0QEK1_PSEPJ|nr:UBA-like protein [Pseudocohnilembus persalinus]|eukprot:KRX00636.1 UBA-like protein [Pseudocohnilembus persalinus]
MDQMSQIQELISITGLPQDQAQMYLEMSGGSIDLAVSMYFESMDQGQGSNQQNFGNQDFGGNNQELSPEKLLWPDKVIPESWKIQGLEFDENNPLGLKQHQNGPCGPLSVINAVLISQLIKNDNFDLNKKVTDEELTKALITILNVVVQQDQEYIICYYNSLNEIKQDKFKGEQQAFQFLLKNLNQYKIQGGIVLFLYSLVLTKGLDKIKEEVSKSGGELPLIVRPFNICVTDLIMLMISGEANGNVGDFSQFSNEKIQVNNRLGIGLLTSVVHQMNIPINDALLTPQNNVFILHGGEHFTVMFTLEKDLSKEQIEFYQWNGLKPGGPRMCKFLLKTKGDVIKKNIEPQQYKKIHTHYKPEIGEFDSVIQANSEDKKNYPNNYTKWNYECAIIVHDEENADFPPRPQDMPKPKLYEQGENKEGPWRCLACYSKRFKTMCFGQNEGGDVCQNCGIKKEHCGWSIYLPFEKLPSSAKRSLRRQHGPKIIGILETKWPSSDVEFLDKPEQPTI